MIGVNAYDEYGVPGVPNLGRFQYTGQMWLPEAQLYHYKARAYLPALGRFAQTDPVLFAGGVNLYAYVGNDPVNATDPLGLQSQPPECRDEPGDNECTITVTASGDNCRFPLCVNDPQAIDALVDRFGTTVQQTGEDEITVTGRRRCDRARAARRLGSRTADVRHRGYLAVIGDQPADRDERRRAQHEPREAAARGEEARAPADRDRSAP